MLRIEDVIVSYNRNPIRIYARRGRGARDRAARRGAEAWKSRIEEPPKSSRFAA